jgi:hypothetical protein
LVPCILPEAPDAPRRKVARETRNRSLIARNIARSPYYRPRHCFIMTVSMPDVVLTERGDTYENLQARVGTLPAPYARRGAAQADAG